MRPRLKRPVPLALVFFLVALALPAAQAAGQGYPWRMNPPLPATGFNLSGFNATPDRGPIPGEYLAPPDPVTLFRFELNETTLPGGRYMAYGPSVIGLALPPAALAILVALAAAGIGAGYFLRRRREEG